MLKLICEDGNNKKKNKQNQVVLFVLLNCFLTFKNEKEHANWMEQVRAATAATASKYHEENDAINWVDKTDFICLKIIS